MGYTIWSAGLGLIVIIRSTMNNLCDNPVIRFRQDCMHVCVRRGKGANSFSSLIHIQVQRRVMKERKMVMMMVMILQEMWIEREGIS